MDAKHYLVELNQHLSHLYAFARRMNELDFAISVAGEFRGAQDPGWATTITAHEAFQELTEHFKKADVRIALFLYCQLAEAGGVYESVKNLALGLGRKFGSNVLVPGQDVVDLVHGDFVGIYPGRNLGGYLEVLGIIILAASRGESQGRN